MRELFNPLAIICFTTGLVFIVAAFITKKYPPKKINSTYGYRTKTSMQSKERWDFSQTYSTQHMLKYGAILLVFGVIGYYLPFSELVLSVIGIALIIILTIALYLKTEYAIKEKFDNQ